MNLKNKKNEKELTNELILFVDKNKGTLTQKEVLTNLAIGIDEKKKSLFLVKKTIKDTVCQSINLAEIKNSLVIKNRKSDSRSTIIETIELAFFNLDTNKPEVYLGLYAIDENNLNVVHEFELANKWSALINSKVKK
jgi:hypothetical protein